MTTTVWRSVGVLIDSRRPTTSRSLRPGQPQPRHRRGPRGCALHPDRRTLRVDGVEDLARLGRDPAHDPALAGDLGGLDDVGPSAARPRPPAGLVDHRRLAAAGGDGKTLAYLRTTTASTSRGRKGQRLGLPREPNPHHRHDQHQRKTVLTGTIQLRQRAGKRLVRYLRPEDASGDGEETEATMGCGLAVPGASTAHHRRLHPTGSVPVRPMPMRPMCGSRTSRSRRPNNPPFGQPWRRQHRCSRQSGTR